MPKVNRQHIMGLISTIAAPRCVANKEALTFGASDQVKSFTITAEGVLFFALIDQPTWTDAATATLSIENDNGDEIYAKGSLAEGTKTKINVSGDNMDVPLVDTNIVKFTLNTAAGGTGGTAYITLYVI